MGVEQASELVGAAVPRSGEDGIDRPLHLRRARIALLEFAGEQLDRLVPGLLGDLMNAAAVVVGRAGIEAGLEGAADRLDIAVRAASKTALRSVFAGAIPSTCALSCRQLAKP